jgi:UDP-glucose 4-epimerase
MKYLVTGSKGFIGTNLCHELARRGLAYAELDLPNDVSRLEDVRTAALGCDVIVHLAAISGIADCEADPARAILTNVLGTSNVCQVGRRVVFASSGAVYGGGLSAETTKPRPQGIYACSKLLGEQLVDVSLRFSNVYGAYSEHKTSVIHRFVRQALRGDELVVNGRDIYRDFIYVEDLVDAIIRAANSDFRGAVNISSGTGHEIGVVAGMVCRAAGVPHSQVQQGRPRVGDVSTSTMNPDLAQEQLGWIAQTSLKTGIEKTVEWYRTGA